MEWIKLITSFAVCQAAGLIGALFTANSVKGWYLTLNKPSFNPPGWVFGPVWTLLYLMMGVSVYLIWKQSGEQKIRFAVIVFIIQLVLNTLWSALFFGMQNPALAFVEIIILWIAILACIILFYPLSGRASYLLIPYLLWVSFAAVLNYSIWQLNR